MFRADDNEILKIYKQKIQDGRQAQSDSHWQCLFPPAPRPGRRPSRACGAPWLPSCSPSSSWREGWRWPTASSAAWRKVLCGRRRAGARPCRARRGPELPAPGTHALQLQARLLGAQTLGSSSCCVKRVLLSWVAERLGSRSDVNYS